MCVPTLSATAQKNKKTKIRNKKKLLCQIGIGFAVSLRKERKLKRISCMISMGKRIYVHYGNNDLFFPFSLALFFFLSALNA